MSHEFDTRREEWIAREELAERMIPLIGGLYRRHGVVTSIHGRRLINASTVDLLKAHRFARQAGDGARARADTKRVREARGAIQPAPPPIDGGRLVARFHTAAPGTDLVDFLRSELAPVLVEGG